jgi:hypothetical protein
MTGPTDFHFVHPPRETSMTTWSPTTKHRTQPILIRSRETPDSQADQSPIQCAVKLQSLSQIVALSSSMSIFRMIQTKFMPSSCSSKMEFPQRRQQCATDARRWIGLTESAASSISSQSSPQLPNSPHPLSALLAHQATRAPPERQQTDSTLGCPSEWCAKPALEIAAALSSRDSTVALLKPRMRVSSVLLGVIFKLCKQGRMASRTVARLLPGPMKNVASSSTRA